MKNSSLSKARERHALLVAGMHRSGTSALTRVLSLLGADLPGKLAPALPQNNETGFWESTDLMIIHDELLESAGSSWSDWTGFNQDWYQSTQGREYYNRILSVVRNDFSASTLFAIKDPRICRFLPLWLDVLEEFNSNPSIIIPVRNPLEVALSLKNRDGFPLSKGGLIWLRHVLDAIHFSEGSSRVIVDFADLMMDWRTVVKSIAEQLKISFPCASVNAELDIEAFLDQRQKHNNFTLGDVANCREFSPIIARVYELLLLLRSHDTATEAFQELDGIRADFSEESWIYAKALTSNERLIRAQKDNFESKLSTQKNDYELDLQQQKNKYEQQLIDQALAYEARINCWGQEVQRVRLQKKSAERQASLLRKQLIEAIEYTDRSESNRIICLLDVDWYCSQYPDVSQVNHPDPLGHYLVSGMIEGRQPHILFDVSWYLKQYPDIAGHELGAVSHYLQYGGQERRNPHPLFHSEFYVRCYPDALSAGLSPLEHYLQYGAAWGCEPHPLFNSQFYRRQLREVVSDEESLLAHYLKNRHLWRLSPSPCFDAEWYLDKYPDVVEAGINPLLHYALFGIDDGRQPHPDADEPDFQLEYSTLYEEVGVDLKQRKAKLLKRLEAKQKKNPVGDERFRRMLDYQLTDLQPDSAVFRENSLLIHWVTCDFAPEGGGGNATIFRFVRLFEQFGHQQRIWLHNKVAHDQAGDAYEDLVRNYQQTSVSLAFIEDSPEDFAQAQGDIIIATDWESVWPVLSAKYFKRRFYFVQDHEASFFPAGGHSLAAEMTYQEDLDCICAGPWLEKLMQERYGRWATKFWLAADQTVYFPVESEADNKVPRIAFYARATTSRRAVELGLLALDFLAEKNTDFHVDIFGSDANQQRLASVKFNYTDHGVLNATQLGELYRCCDVGMVFSATNYSLVPQEMMACGLAVLEMDGENTRSVYPEGGVVLAKPHPRELSERLSELLGNAEQRREIAHVGRLWASRFNWENTARDVSQAIQQRLLDKGYQKVSDGNASAIKVSVVIPSLNGGDLLLSVLDKLGEQKAPWSFDVLVIDSGSSDGTPETMKKRNGVRVHSIPPETFSHGGTRNLGVEMSSGEYIAFLTQDAMPVDEHWLFNLVSALEYDSEVAGAFGKHLAYPNASPFVQRDLEQHFSALASHPLYLSRDTDRTRFDSVDQGWRQLLHFYSDNNSCMRRSVWEKVPYPVIDYGEDQVWADQIIKAGFKKAYAINAVVYHSHDYDEQETFERSRVEAAFFEKHFGYVMLADEKDMQQRLDAMNEADKSYARQHEISEQLLEQQLALNEAKLRGYLSVSGGAL